MALTISSDEKTHHTFHTKLPTIPLTLGNVSTYMAQVDRHNFKK
jgi:hypothetical protein